MNYCEPKCAPPAPGKIQRTSTGSGWWDCPQCACTYALRVGDPRIPPPEQRAPTPAERERTKRLCRERLAELEHKSPMLHATVASAYAKWEERTRSGLTLDLPFDAETYEARVNAAASASGLPERLVELYSRGEVWPTAAREWVLEAIDAGYGSIVLCGRTGTGKSVAAGFAIWQRLTASNAHASLARWYSVRDLATRQWFASGEEQRRELDRLRETLRGVSLLVLDDLGQEPGATTDETSVWRSELWAIYEARHGTRGLTTICTTQLAPMEIIQHYGSNLWRRMAIHRDGDARPVNVRAFAEIPRGA